MNDICFYFVSNLLRLYRYLWNLSIKAKLLNFKIISSTQSKSKAKKTDKTLTKLSRALLNWAQWWFLN